MLQFSVKTVLAVTATFFSAFFNAQDLDSLMGAAETEAPPPYTTALFKTTKLVNLQTIEQVKGGELDFRISHRFDDAGGTAGGIKTLYGFDNISDIRISFDYGITDWLVIGIGRSKGAHIRRQVVDLNSKVKLLRQRNNNSVPVSVSLYIASEVSTMQSSSDTFSTAYFGKSLFHRVNYVSQLILARKFNDNFSMLIAPTVLHRNLVHYTQKNTSFALAAGLRYKFTKRFGVIVDYYYNLDRTKSATDGYYDPLGIGIEIETGGHVFHLLFSNNKSLLETQFLTQNTDNWLKGQFRFGFNISRVFNVL